MTRYGATMVVLVGLCVTGATCLVAGPATSQVLIDARVIEARDTTIRDLGMDWQLSFGAHTFLGGEAGSGPNIGTELKITIPQVTRKLSSSAIDRVYGLAGADYTKLPDASSWTVEGGIGMEALLAPLAFTVLDTQFQTKLLVEASLSYSHLGPMTEVRILDPGCCHIPATTIEVEQGNEGALGVGVVAGLLAKPKVDKKIPVLGNIPILGVLFKARGTASDLNGGGRSQLMILVTATIVR